MPLDYAIENPSENPSRPPFSKGRGFPLFGKEGPGEIPKSMFGQF
jgi:hypothetical protein